ncbi:MAG: tRNA (cytidine/uridine/adenosine-2'-O-)-methyltransferase TrmJ [Legionellaceae bacterium]
MLNNIAIILIDTSHPGNIGAAARAMKNMGIHDLRLVNPVTLQWEEAIARSAGAEDILNQAKIYEEMNLAIADCSLVIGTSARSRSFHWPLLSIHEDAEKILHQAKTTKVAIVFGRESSGLTNEELQRCQYHLTIPVTEIYSSLNLAAAVQIICYELYKTNITLTPDSESLPIKAIASHNELEKLYQHLEKSCIEVKFLNPHKPGLLMARFRKLFNRCELTKVELNILRGFLSAILKRKSL